MNVLRDKWRKTKHQGPSINIDELGLDKTDEEDMAEISAQRELINNALNRLSKDQCTVIELRIIKGYSITEAARLMKKKEGAIRDLQYRAIKALTTILKNNDGQEELKNE